MQQLPLQRVAFTHLLLVCVLQHHSKRQKQTNKQTKRYHTEITLLTSQFFFSPKPGSFLTVFIIIIIM